MGRPGSAHPPIISPNKGGGGGLIPCIQLHIRKGGGEGGGGGGWHKALELGCVPLAAPMGLSPLHILTLCGSERVLVVSTEPPDDLSCLTTPGVGRPGDGLLPVPVTGGWGGQGRYPPSPPQVYGRF